MSDDDDFPMAEEIMYQNPETFGFEDQKEAAEKLLEQFDWEP